MIAIYVGSAMLLQKRWNEHPWTRLRPGALPLVLEQSIHPAWCEKARITLEGTADLKENSQPATCVSSHGWRQEQSGKGA